MSMSSLLVIAGPPGAGKSTISALAVMTTKPPTASTRLAEWPCGKTLTEPTGGRSDLATASPRKSSCALGQRAPLWRPSPIPTMRPEPSIRAARKRV